MSQPPSPTDLAYAAALIDGEGCIRIQRVQKMDRNLRFPRYCLTVKITMKDREALDFMSARFGGSSVKEYSSRGKSAYHWGIYGTNAGKFVAVILPYLLVKKSPAEEVLRFQELMDKGQGKGHQRPPEIMCAMEGHYRVIRAFNQRHRIKRLFKGASNGKLAHLY